MGPFQEHLKTAPTRYFNCLLEKYHVVSSDLHSTFRGAGCRVRVDGGAEKAIRERFASKPGLLFLIHLGLAYCIGTETFQGALWVKEILSL